MLIFYMKSRGVDMKDNQHMQIYFGMWPVYQ